MATFTVPSPDAVAGEPGFIGDINNDYAALTAAVAGNVLNTAYAGGADNTGAADATLAVQAAVTEAGFAYLPPGTYLFNSAATVTLVQAGAWITGAGPLLTKIVIGAAFSGAQVIYGNAEGVAVENLTIAGPSSATAGNPACDAVYFAGQRYCRLVNVEFEYVNGWCLNNVGPGYATMTDRCSTYKTCAGGFHFQGLSGSTWGSQAFLSGLNAQQVGVGTGANANLDCFRFEDCFDVLGVNFNASVSDASTGSAVNITGKCASIYLTNMDLGCFPNSASAVNAVIRIQDGANGSPSDIRFVQGEAQQGLYGLYMTGACKHVWFTSFRFFNNYSHGAYVASTGVETRFGECSWSLNGQAGSGTSYDLEWTGAATGKVLGGEFSTPVTGSGAGVANPMDFTGAGVVEVADCNAYGTGTTSSNVFTSSTPKYIFRTTPWNPHGAVAISVPASGSAASGRTFDMIFYITAGASTVSCVVTGGASATIVIPSGGFGQVFVPAGQTLTPTYTSAPTWVVYGN